MKFVVVEPGQYARIEELNGDSESLQKVLGGRFIVFCWEDKSCIICTNKSVEGGIFNRNVESYQPIAGPFIVSGVKGRSFGGLTDEQAKRYREMLFQPELFIPYKDGHLWLKYDDPNLPGAPDTLKQEYESRHGLPMYSFYPAPDRNMIMSIRYGESGYWPVEHIPEGMTAEEYADKLNQTLGVSKAQQTAMLYGSMFGWDSPAARPERYDENGQPKPRDQRRDNQER